MDKDTRLYAKFALDFLEHRKIEILSDSAFRTFVGIICYSRKHLLDGLLPARFVLLHWNPADVDELCANDAEKPSLTLVGEHYIVHDINDHQTTRAEIEALREARVSAGRKGGIASAQARAKAKANHRQSNGSSKRSSKIKPETETESTKPLMGFSTTDARAAPPKGAAHAPVNGATPHHRETFEEALARADREAREIF